MKNILNNSIKCMCVAAAALFAAGCSDWTQTESLKIGQTDATTQNPEEYARYLANLREYKKSDHKIVLGWFGNVEVASSRGHHLTQVPDSVDIISLMNPDNLPAWVVAEKNAVREQKGTRCVYTVSCTELKAAWKKYQEELAEQPAPESENAVTGDTFETFADKYFDTAFALCKKYDYDGVMAEYTGKSTAMMTPEEIEAYTVEQNLLIGAIKDWKTANKNRMLIFEGDPQYVLDKEFLQSCAYILLPTRELASVEFIVKSLLMANVEGVPSDRFLIAVQTPTLDGKNPETGYFGSEHAVTQAAYLVASPSVGYTKAGLAVYNLQNDYFNLNQVYQYTRGALDIMNPSPKN